MSQDRITTDSNKKLTTVFRELERVQTQVLSRVSLDDLQNATVNMADKAWVKSQMTSNV